MKVKNLQKQKAVVLCSVSMDSVAALHQAARDFVIWFVLSFHYAIEA